MVTPVIRARGFISRGGFPKAGTGTRLAEILTDLSAKTLAAAIEENSYAYWLEYGKGPGGEIHDGPELLWFASGVPHGLMNGVMRARLPPGEVDRHVEGIKEEFRARGLPLEWNVGIGTEPRDLGRTLMAHGFDHPLDIEGMAMDLEEFREEPAPAGLSIDIATSRPDIETFLRIAGKGFEIPDAFVRQIVELEASLGPAHEAIVRRYLGRVDEKPVASSLLFQAAGVAGLYNVVTLPEMRGRGIAAAMTRAALQGAKELGYRVAVLQASPMGRSIYRRLGFRDFFPIELYVWSPGPKARKIRLARRRR